MGLWGRRRGFDWWIKFVDGLLFVSKGFDGVETGRF